MLVRIVVFLPFNINFHLAHMIECPKNKHLLHREKALYGDKNVEINVIVLR